MSLSMHSVMVRLSLVEKSWHRAVIEGQKRPMSRSLALLVVGSSLPVKMTEVSLRRSSAGFHQMVEELISESVMEVSPIRCILPSPSRLKPSCGTEEE